MGERKSTDSARFGVAAEWSFTGIPSGNRHWERKNSCYAGKLFQEPGLIVKSEFCYSRRVSSSHFLPAAQTLSSRQASLAHPAL
jgi:hypothetical protein